MNPQFDERDEQIRQKSLAALDLRRGPRCGDWVDFANGVRRRISHIWDFEDGSPITVQTSSEGGGYHLMESGHVSFSGQLYRSVPAESLTLTDEKRDGRVWFFHHGFAQAHCGVDTTVPFRVYTCNLDAPE